jgi:hypothetical protein
MRETTIGGSVMMTVNRQVEVFNSKRDGKTHGEARLFPPAPVGACPTTEAHAPTIKEEVES